MKRRKIAQMPLRLPAELHEELKQAAAQQGLSLNQYCLFLLARYGLENKDWQRHKGEALLQFWQESQTMARQLKGPGLQAPSTPPIEIPKKRWKRLYANH